MRISYSRFSTAKVITILMWLVVFAFGTKPEWSDGMLFLRVESGPQCQSRSGYSATMAGVATWFKAYQVTISKFVTYNPNYGYWDYLPSYGYTQITAQKLANMIWYDQYLGFSPNTPAEIINYIRDALQYDHDVNGAFQVFPTDLIDPFPIWKWRSVYMEDMHSRNGDPTNTEANCWGTANYLTKTWDWVNGYSYYKQRALNDGCLLTYASFPYIYLDGPIIKSNPAPPLPPQLFVASMDSGLANRSYPVGGFAYCGSYDPGYNTGNQNISTVLNAFDVIRLSLPPNVNDRTTLTLNGVNLGVTTHDVTYLCTSNDGKHWFYQKLNLGPTSTQPYGVHAFGISIFEGVPWSHQTDLKYRSYFRHADDKKCILPSDYQTNWANIVP